MSHEDAIDAAQAPPDHVAMLRRAFPGVWIRGDGAFRIVASYDDDTITAQWTQGDKEFSPSSDGRLSSSDGRLKVKSVDLTASQLRALLVYIDAQSSSATHLSDHLESENDPD